MAIANRTGWPNERKAVRGGRPAPHPFAHVIIAQFGKQRRNLAFDKLQWPRLRRRLGAGKFHHPRTSDAPFHWGHNKFAGRNHHRRFGHGAGIVQLNVIAALAFQSQALDPKLFCHLARPSPHGQNNMIASHRALICDQGLINAILHLDIVNLRRKHRAAFCLKMGQKRGQISPRV